MLAGNGGKQHGDRMGADPAGGAVVGAATLDGDVARPADLHDRTERQSALAEGALDEVAITGALQAGDHALVGHGLAFLEGLPAGQSPHPVFRDFHVVAAGTEQRARWVCEGKDDEGVIWLGRFLGYLGGVALGLFSRR